MHEKKNRQNKIYALGETVLDLIFKDGGLTTAKAGGSVLNAASSLAALGRDVELISECGRDAAGDLILTHLKTCRVGTRFVHRYENYPTALVQAALDDRGQPTYTMSKIYPPQRLEMQKDPDFEQGDVLMFGSGAALDPALAPAYERLTDLAKERGALLIYDPNLRPAYVSKWEESKVLFERNCQKADLIKASAEDLEIAFGITDPLLQWQELQKYGAALIRTDAHRPVQMFLESQHIEVAIEPVDVLSAIGAGDTFNAGIADALVRYGLSAGAWRSSDAWPSMIRRASAMAALVCSSYDNSLSPYHAQVF